MNGTAYRRQRRFRGLPRPYKIQESRPLTLNTLTPVSPSTLPSLSRPSVYIWSNPRQYPLWKRFAGANQLFRYFARPQRKAGERVAQETENRRFHPLLLRLSSPHHSVSSLLPPRSRCSPSYLPVVVLPSILNLDRRSSAPSTQNAFRFQSISTPKHHLDS